MMTTPKWAPVEHHREVGHLALFYKSLPGETAFILASHLVNLIHCHRLIHVPSDDSSLFFLALLIEQ